MKKTTWLRFASWRKAFVPVGTLSLAFAFAFSASAAFYPAASSGPTGDPQGELMRGKIASAISTADGLLAVLENEDPSVWSDPWRPFYGTAAAKSTATAVREVRAALAALRDNWDRLSLQTVTLKKGWNSFCVYVADPAPAAAVINPSGYSARLRARVAESFVDPSEANAAACLDVVAGLAGAYVGVRTALVGTYASGLTLDWPVESVYAYMGSTDAAAQFSTDVSAEAAGSNPYLTWSAAAPDNVNFATFPVGRVYSCFSTDAKGARTVGLLGTRVRAGSMSWHKTGGSENPAEWNFLGVSVVSGRPSAEKLMKDLDFTSAQRAKVTGLDPEKPDFTVAAAGESLTVADGETLVASATASSTWYPAPTATPSDGVTIAAGGVETTFQLRNDTAAAQTVTGTLYRTGNLTAALKGVAGVQVRRSAAADWQAWNFDQSTGTNKVFVDTLAAHESRTYRLRFPRTLWDLLAREGAYSGEFRRIFSGVMRFRYGSNPACTYLSVTAASDNSAIVTPWPAGLWAGTFAFDRVSQVKGNQTIVHDVPAAGVMCVRGLVHVDGTGTCRLLHHVVIENVTSSNATDGAFVETRLYAGRAKPTGSGGTVSRLDSIAMDIDNPVVEGTGGVTNAVTFAWTMRPDGRGNPFHHPYHPDHDGLQWDFKTPAPSGDDMNNYRQGEVKPETWSISNEVTLQADAFDAMEIPGTLTGTCTWSLGNVRRSVNGENIRASGRYSLTRVKSVGTLTVE